MKYVIVFSLLLISLSGKSQNSNYYLDSMYLNQSLQKAGTCASQDGTMYSIPAPPPNYTWLEGNGYCNANTYGTSATVCWTFIPTSSSITLNSGYSQTGCANISFNSFNLYNSSCTLIGTGLNFTGLTPGQSYTWCMSGTAWGGGPSCLGFTDFCPYFTNNITLPIELDFFDGKLKDDYVLLNWVTLTETNNDYFTIEKSLDAKYWDEYYRIPGLGNTNTPSMYQFEDHDISSAVIYYRLKQTDYNGEFKIYSPIAVTIPIKYNIPVAYNIFGDVIQDPDNYKGLIIYKYQDGRYKKIINLR